MTDPYPTTTPQRTLTIPTLPQYRLPLHVSPTQITAAPEKRILEPTDMPTFRVSSARLEILLFIMTCTQHAILQVSNNKHPLAQWLQQMEQAITLFPSENDTAKQRFGSPKFREWHQYITTEAQNWIQETYKFEDGNITAALTHFMSTSFGSPQRLDYGTGHELTFFQLLGTLYKFQLMSIEECLDVIPRYYGVVDAIITHYKLEPAGSHGVWGLDDHFHIAYIIGAAQLTKHTHFTPKSTVGPLDVLEHMSAKGSLYCSRLMFIHKSKFGPFHEHSSMLHDMSAVPKWEKVCEGLLKMYINEVLEKYPIVQHLYFWEGVWSWHKAEIVS